MNNSNPARLKALLDVFDIPIAQVAKLVGKSRPLVSRVLSGDLKNDNLFALLENKLPELIALKRKPYFHHSGTDMSLVEKCFTGRHVKNEDQVRIPA